MFYFINKNSKGMKSIILANTQVLPNSDNSKKKRLYANWNSEEDKMLTYLVSNVGPKWKFISKYFPNKTVIQIYNRYLKIDPNIKHGRFTKEEDSLIMRLTQQYGNKWPKISSIIKTRSGKQIRYRYLKHLSKKIKFDEFNINNNNNSSNLQSTKLDETLDKESKEEESAFEASFILDVTNFSE